MKYVMALAILLLLVLPVVGQKINDKETKEKAKQEERDRKQRERQEQAAYLQRMAQPPTETFPINANLAGQYLATATQERGFTFAGYQPSAQVFGAGTAQMALFTTGLTWGEAASTGFSIGLAGARSYGDPFKFVAFAINEVNGQSVVVGKIGIASITTGGWYIKDLTSVEMQRITLTTIFRQVKNAAEQLVSNQKVSEETKLQGYQRVKIGMPLEEVLGILGGGRSVSENETATLKTVVYEWTSGDSRITATFENNKLSQKSQTGLQAVIPSSPAQPVTSDSDKTVVYMVSQSIFYHYNQSCPRNVPNGSAISITEAKKAGGHACSTCKPKDK